MSAQKMFHLRLAMLGALFGLGACQGAPAPLVPAMTSVLGQRAREFPNTPEEVWEATRAALVAQGFVLREDQQERGFIHAHTIDLESGSVVGDDRSWTRVTARIDYVDHHKRAPRTTLEVEAERLHGSSGGAIEASIGQLDLDFYERFFEDIAARLPQPLLPQLAVPGFE
ncbi:MAG: hypothetical protein R3F49_22895 [Planctomycetota bacterium]